MKTAFEIINPATGKSIAERLHATASDIQVAIDKANEAKIPWRKTKLEERIVICTRAVEYLVHHADKLGEELTNMMGRPIRYTPNEIRGGLKERAQHMMHIAPEVLSDISTSDKNGFSRFIKREPLGNVLVLAPWNYPYLTAVNVVIPALVAGNTVILKHAKQTALVAERFYEAFVAAGLPEGVFQYLHLTHDSVAALIADKNIDYVAFTGSVEGGQAIQKAVGSRFISTGLELGGKDPAYVCEDADWSYTIENIVDGVFFNSGQSCCAIERIYVAEPVFSKFVDDFVSLTKKYQLGNPLDPSTTLGPMVRKKNAEFAKNQVEKAVAAGAITHISQGDFPALEFPYFAPQVLTNVNHNMELMTIESFAPLVGIMPVKNDKEAIELMNDSPYGLTSSIWTTDPDRALHVGNEVETGTWFMNRCDYLDPELAWTGVKDTGKGCTLSSLGYEQITRPKSFHLKIDTR